MAKSNRDQNELFEQKRVPQIEAAILKADEKRAEIEAEKERSAKVVDGLKDELEPLEKAIKDALHAFEDRIDKHGEGAERELIYQRGIYGARVKAHERLSYDKIRDPKQGEASE